MNVKKDCLVSLAIVAALAVPSMAQHAGFRIAIAPAAPQPMIIPGFAQPVAPFTNLPTSTFAYAPAPAFGFPPHHVPHLPVVVTNRGFLRQTGFVGAPFGTFAPQFPQTVGPSQIIAPAHVIGPTHVVGAALIPVPVIVPPVILPVPVIAVPQSHFGPPQAQIVFPIGTPRERVIRQFGQPAVTIITRGAETLQFRGGVTVIIQDGQVAGPK